MQEERSVGFINYEVAIRGKQHLEAASRKMTINKSIDIALKEEALDIRRFRKPAQEIKEIKTQWRKKVLENQAAVYSDKEQTRLRDECTKYKLLSDLKNETFPGPFTSPEEISLYVRESKAEEKEMNKRMYDEVKYARMTSFSLKPTNSLFRLKRNYKNLPTEEYVDNLTQYLSKATSCKTLTLQDLSNVMIGIAGKSLKSDLEHTESHEKPKEKNVSDLDQLQQGEHIIAFWIEGNDTKWNLGVVDTVLEADKFIVSYLTRTDTAGKSWAFPQNSDINETSVDQILARKVKVNYSGDVRIKCQIECSLIEKMNSLCDS